MAVKSALQIISATAKQIRRKHPGKAWKTCIQEASVIYRRSHPPADDFRDKVNRTFRGGIGSASSMRAAAERKRINLENAKEAKRKIKPKQRGKPDNKTQTGSSVKKLDQSAAGNWYYERRKNRSDKPGSLTGTGVYAASTMQRLQKELDTKDKAMIQIAKLKQLSKDKGRTAKDKGDIKRAQVYYGKIVRSSTQHISNLKKLL